MRRDIITIVLLTFAVTLIACKTNAPAPEKAAGPVETTKETAMIEKKAFSEPKVPQVDMEKKYTAIIRTSKGEIVAELYAKDAPLSATNFKQLADGGFYEGLTFHRVEPGFVVQGGDPDGTGSGGPGYTIPAEIKRKHNKGALAWARTGDEVNPERRSSGSQFYITLSATPFLDDGYTVFGQTISGMDVVEKIRRGDTIEWVEVKAE